MTMNHFYDGDDRSWAAVARHDVDPDRRRLAVRAVASRAVDASDCAQLLAVLGLDPSEGVSSVERAS